MMYPEPSHFPLSSPSFSLMVPYFLSELLHKAGSRNDTDRGGRGLARVALFLGYLAAISRMEDIQRVFMYHGAEHKCINCVEHGLELERGKRL